MPTTFSRRPWAAIGNQLVDADGNPIAMFIDHRNLDAVVDNFQDHSIKDRAGLIEEIEDLELQVEELGKELTQLETKYEESERRHNCA